MKTQRLVRFAIVLVLLATMGSAVGAIASPLPLDTDRPAAPQTGQAIIIDHTTTDITKIPDYWIEQAKQLTFHYAHTSHGGQIRSGIEKLEQVNPKYNIRITNAGATPPTSLPGGPGELRIYDGNPPETYIEPPDYWSTLDGINRTRAVANTGLFGFSMWSWCSQQSSNPTQTVQLYLDTLNQFEQEYPSMRFIYMTGHTDGGSATLARNNDMVRDYVRNNGKVLFDFADIETYDPLGGGPYNNNSEGNCTWCVTFCSNHPEYCTDLPSYCAHTDDHPEDQLFCKLKGQAFWWMMARLAGWDGTTQQAPTSYKAVSRSNPQTGQTITYSIVLRNLSAPLTATIHVTDVVPTGLSYVAGTFTATSGAITVTAPTLRWTGMLSPTPIVTISYATLVTEENRRLIANPSTVVVPGSLPLTLDAPIVVNGYAVYLPVIAK